MDNLPMVKGKYMYSQSQADCEFCDRHQRGNICELKPACLEDDDANDF